MFVVLFSMPVLAISQQELYDITFHDINNKPIALNTFSGKKIVISVIDAARPDELYLKMLDTLYRNNNTTVQVIAVPVSNFGNAISNDSLTVLFKKLNLSYIISKTAEGRKENNHQHPILYWVTHVSSNKRFDNDIEEPGQLFVISESGVLYAVMKRKISPTGATMNKVISQQIRKS